MASVANILHYSTRPKIPAKGPAVNGQRSRFLTAQAVQLLHVAALEAENLHQLIIAKIIAAAFKAHFWPLLPPLTPVLYYSRPSPVSC
jgi:hypothetical protein